MGLTADEMVDDDRRACQQVGEAASFLGYQGVHAPSATGIGAVIAVFEPRLRPGQLTLERSYEIPRADSPPLA